MAAKRINTHQVPAGAIAVEQAAGLNPKAARRLSACPRRLPLNRRGPARLDDDVVAFLCAVALVLSWFGG